MKVSLIRNPSLQKKFIIIAFSTVILIMVVMVLLNIRRERAILYRDIERQGRILAETLAIPVMNDLIYEKLGIVEEGGLIDNYVTEIFQGGYVELMYLAVLDAKGRVISHNDFNEYGKVYNDRITLKSLYSESTVVQKYNDSEIGHDILDFATPLSIGKKRWGTLKFGVSLHSLDEEMKAVILNGIIVTLIFLTVGLVVIILLSRRFIRPITELARTMKQAGGGALDVHVDIRGKDEIALLGQNFNSMIDRIRESNARLKQNHNELLHFVRAIQKTRGDVLDTKVDIEGCDEINLLCQSFNDMIERIRESNIELKKTHEKLFHSQKLASLGVLASGVAHEINNPLGGMFNCVEMIEKDGNDEDFRKKYLGLIRNGLNRIETIVSKLLWISRKDKRSPQMINIGGYLKDICQFIDYRIKSKNITCTVKVDKDASLLIDPQDFHQIMMNLMINAIQSMDNGGLLSVCAGTNGSGTILKVSDTGQGIDKDEITKIFDPFYTTKSPGEGTGLGLWVTYEIVNNYNGEIAVESRKHEGTTFTVKFNSRGKA